MRNYQDGNPTTRPAATGLVPEGWKKFFMPISHVLRTNWSMESSRPVSLNKFKNVESLHAVSNSWPVPHGDRLCGSFSGPQPPPPLPEPLTNRSQRHSARFHAGGTPISAPGVLSLECISSAVSRARADAISAGRAGDVSMPICGLARWSSRAGLLRGGSQMGGRCRDRSGQVPERILETRTVVQSHLR